MCTMQATPKLEIHNSLNCDPQTNNSGSEFDKEISRKNVFFKSYNAII